jgi:hypothetical protein
VAGDRNRARAAGRLSLVPLDVHHEAFKHLRDGIVVLSIANWTRSTGPAAAASSWHLSALGAALSQLVGYIVGDVPRPSFVGVERDYPNWIVALTF